MLHERYSKDELESLCNTIGARWDDLRGDTLPAKAGALVRWAETRNRLYTLLIAVIKERPDIDWREPRAGGGWPTTEIVPSA